MNRRSFIGKLGTIAAAFSILPAATSYARNWKFTRTVSGIWVINPEWANAPYEMAIWTWGDANAVVEGWMNRGLVSGWIERGREPGIHPPGYVKRIYDAIPVRAVFDRESFVIVNPFKHAA